MGTFSLDKTRENVFRAITPLKKPQPDDQGSGSRAVFKGIPHHEYYLIFLLLVDLLDFKYWGPGEKVAYIIPVGFEGFRYSIVYAKFGMKIEYSEGGNAAEVYAAIKRGIKAAKPYYLWRAETASCSSDLNLISKCPQLWDKYIFLKEQSEALMGRFVAEKDNVVVEKGESSFGNWTSVSYPAYKFKNQSIWLHEAAVDAFFGWCEQALVHIAVLMGKLSTGKEIAELLRQEFGEKCKLILDLSDIKDKSSFDDILDLRVQLRNYVAHGSFGKDGSTFQFHSRVGAVPLKILDQHARSEFSFGTYRPRDWERDYARIDSFLGRLWSGSREPAKLYLETGFPCVLTYVMDGTYHRAMLNRDEMRGFIEHLSRQIDDAANMDF
ncbi:hypothetical protein F11_04380 [Rhodospirillum rubrum F11]|uniref:hypothetical protein n=1 Tax=Rhodospirillum rubrum TaxID=1085 RepID=UPI000229D72C|nr:hypothetical protein [Rhodospirillum rubrum]AEO47346.1 hypothetical protein F11_04380 [Rhodospirillum rubrum F11]QXG81316.1 hypothetical protein KUL73_04435 [Rhodospirillum rubrum]